METPNFEVSPTEHNALICKLGPSSPDPELHGCDILWSGRDGKWGIQRKELADLIASVKDGRLGMELSQMQVGLRQGVVVVEGTPHWTPDGALLNGSRWTNWDLSKHRGVELAIQKAGMWLMTSRSPADTCAIANQLFRWSWKQGPSTLLSAPPAERDEWGRATSEGFAMRLLSTFPGISVVIAQRIFKKFGRAPLRWTLTADDLQEVEGIGKVRAQRLIKALEEVADAEA